MTHPLLLKNSHRPFPIPETAWVMSQSWEQLLFAHWPINADKLQSLIPTSLKLDLYDDSAWIGVVPFAMKGVRPRYLPKIPGHSNFLELNVRTYVTKNGIPGVYFFSLDCSNSLAVWTARTFYHLPYFNADMSLTTRDNGLIAYESKRKNSSNSSSSSSSSGSFKATYRPTGTFIDAHADSLDKFLTERYCLYTTDGRGRLYRGVIHHEVWPLQSAEAEISTNTMTAELGLELPDTPPLLHYSERIDTIEWPLIVINA